MRIKGITSSKDAQPAKTATSSRRMTKYMKKGSKMKKGAKMMKTGSKLSAKGGCGCGGGSIVMKKQVGGKLRNPYITPGATPATDPLNSHRATDQFKSTNLSVGGGVAPTKLALDGPAFKGYVQGRTLNGVPSLNYTGAGKSMYSGRANQGVLARYLAKKNKGLKSVYINGRLVKVPM